MADSSEFVSVLNSFSNNISLKILKTYDCNRNGLNLTDTSQMIEEKTTTVKDHLNRLIDSNLVYIQDKKYYLSYFGELILELIGNFEILNNTRKIFGQLSSGMIPTKFIIKLIPYLKGIKVSSNQWAFMNLGNKIIKIIENTMSKKKIDLRIIGWNSVPIAHEIIRNSFSFNNIAGEKEVIKKICVETNIKIITDKYFLSTIKTDDQNREIYNVPEIKERVLICQNIEKFNFMLIRYNKYITCFLNISQEEGLGPYFIITGKSKEKLGVIEIYEEIFEYFSNKATPLSEILDKN